MTARSGPIAALLAALLALGLLGAATPGGQSVDEDTVNAIGAQLRCVVCQNLSVADSPSETAKQMRDIIRERLAAGDTPEQVIAYFVEKYGIWILLAPPKEGFTLLVWVVPFVSLGLGLVVVGVVVRRWSRRAARPASTAAIDAATRERIGRELQELDR